MSIDELRRRAKIGRNAAQLLEGTDESWRAVQKEIHSMWAGTESGDSETREALYRELHGLKAVRARIERKVADGRKAEEELEHANRSAQRKRSDRES